MVFKAIILVSIFALSNAGYLAPAPLPVIRSAPIAAAPLLRTSAIAIPPTIAKTVEVADFDPNPQYSFAYNIQDALTGDSKNHYETRNGDAVQGSYSLVDPDGTRRIVEYNADPINGFNAVVHKEPLAVNTIAAAPFGYSAPIAKIASPVIPAKAIIH